MTLEELLSQMQLSPEDKKAARNMAIAQAGFAMMGAPKGREWEAVGRAGLVGTQTYQNQLGSLQAGKMDGLKMREYAQKMVDAENARKADAAFNSQLAPLFSGAPQLQNMGPGGPTPANAQAVAPKSRAQIYRQAADLAMANRRPDEAEKYLKMAQSEEDEYGQPQIGVGPDGKPTFAQFGKRGGVKTAEGIAPPPKFREVNRGGQVDILNEYNLPSAGTSLGVTMNPYQSQSLDLERAKFGYQKSKDAQGGGEQKPQLVNGQWVYPPSAQSPTGRAVTPEGLQAPDKPLTESQAKATAFANQMFDASRTISDLAKEGFDGRTAVQQGQIVSAGTEGIPYVPGSAAIPRAIAGAKAQKFQQAELQWTEGALRFMTGANAPKEEVIRNAATYFPRPGDSAAVIARKEDARKNMEESVRLAAGRGDKKLPDMPPVQRGAAAANGLTAEEEAERQALKKRLGRE